MPEGRGCRTVVCRRQRCREPLGSRAAALTRRRLFSLPGPCAGTAKALHCGHGNNPAPHPAIRSGTRCRVCCCAGGGAGGCGAPVGADHGAAGAPAGDDERGTGGFGGRGDGGLPRPDRAAQSQGQRGDRGAGPGGAAQAGGSGGCGSQGWRRTWPAARPAPCGEGPLAGGGAALHNGIAALQGPDRRRRRADGRASAAGGRDLHRDLGEGWQGRLPAHFRPRAATGQRRRWPTRSRAWGPRAIRGT